MTITITLRKKEFTLEKETSVMRAMELLEVSPEAFWQYGMANC